MRAGLRCLLLSVLLATLPGALPTAGAEPAAVAPAAAGAVTGEAAAEALAGLRGPAPTGAIIEPAATDSRSFAGGEPSRLAILLTGHEAGWLGLVEGLKALGVPLTVTTDWREAVRHRMVVVHPVVSGRVLDEDALAALRALPLEGGTLVAFQVLGAAMAATFGIQDMQPSRARTEFRFDEAGGRAPREATVPLGDPAHPGDGLWTFGYQPAAARVLAHFDTGEPALLDNPVGRGHAYALGVDAGDLFLRGGNNRQQGINRSYVNQYEPAADVLLHWIKDRYREAEPVAVTLSGTPAGRELAVMLSHDIDYASSLRNAQEYLAFERRAGIRATYFLQTKYIRDWEDRAFLDDQGVALVRALAHGGMEIGSHSVAHSRVFHHMDPGTGSEQFPDYRPMVPDRLACRGCTVSGEVRVSGFLIGQITGKPPVSFRAGHLLNPAVLPETLAANGYRYGSDATANDLLTHLPVHAHFGRGSTTELPLFEFPVTIEDEERPPLGERLDAALGVAQDVIRDEGIFVVLIHPNVTGPKLAFERALVQALRKRAWFGSIGEFGAWWAARDGVEVDVLRPPEAGAGARVRLRCPRPVAALTLQLPAGWRPADDRRVKLAAPGRAVLADCRGESWVDLLPADSPPQR